MPSLSIQTLLSATLISALAAAPAAGREAVELARGEAPQHPQQPQVAVDETGAIHVAFGVGDLVRYCRSDDGGKSFSHPIDLPAVAELSLGMRRGPRIAVSGPNICVTAIGGKQGKGRDGDVLAMRSTDGGRTWASPVLVNDQADAAREGLHAMASGPGGSICCVWLDLRNRKTEVTASVSVDGGATWSKNLLVYQSPSGSVCECCHPSVAYDHRGRIHVMWRNSLAGARDMYVATSFDGGKTFGPAAKLGSGSWPLKACPMDGGAIAVDDAGKISTVWRREKSIYLALAGEAEERLLGAGEQPWIAATKDGPCVVWLKKRNDTAYLLSPGSTSAVELAQHAADPVLATGPGEQGPLVAAWESRDGDVHTIRCQVVSP